MIARPGIVDRTHAALDSIGRRLAVLIADGQSRLTADGLDRHQVAVFEYVWLAAHLAAADALRRAAQGQPTNSLLSTLADLAAVEAAEAVQTRAAGLLAFAADDVSRTVLHPDEAPTPDVYDRTGARVLAQGTGETYCLDEDHALLRRTFRDFADARVRPIADDIHRHDRLVPDSLIAELRELGCFGLSVPQRYGGFQPDASPDNLAVVLVTEELSRGSLGAAGSLITRPEILAKALLTGGTPEQRQRWLRAIASGEQMVAVSVTEPDYGSDVASLRVSATRGDGGWRLNGAKTWSTFAGRAELLMVLARTDPDLALGHRGLSLFVVEKPRSDGTEFEFHQPGGGRISGRAIATPGYRGMHSFDLLFEDYLVAADNLIGGAEGEGRGFYLQMAGFAGGRLQTAARAVGVMQAAFDEAVHYVTQRKTFGKLLAEYGLTRYKVARMAMLIAAARQLSYFAARETDAQRDPSGVLAALAKLYAARMAEWVTREAQQLHGGIGYAEEHAVSRYFVDARVLAIFEGSEEVLAVRVIGRPLLSRFLPGLAAESV
jgi:(2S)-methylsuccinyl-CoA dehydrogenase